NGFVIAQASLHCPAIGEATPVASRGRACLAGGEPVDRNSGFPGSEGDAMAIYRSEPGMAAGSEAIGILMLDCRLPFIPGDVGNASTYRYPVLFKTVPGLSTAVCLNGAPEFAAAAVAAAKALEVEGVRGISSDCGFMLQFQDAVREAVSVPVCLSSLL